MGAIVQWRGGIIKDSIFYRTFDHKKKVLTSQDSLYVCLGWTKKKEETYMSRIPKISE